VHRHQKLASARDAVQGAEPTFSPGSRRRQQRRRSGSQSNRSAIGGRHVLEQPEHEMPERSTSTSFKRAGPNPERSHIRSDLERSGSYSVPFASASESPLTSGVPPSRDTGGRGKGPDPSPNNRVHHTSLCGVPSARRRTSLPTARRRTGQVSGRRPLEGEGSRLRSSSRRWRAPRVTRTACRSVRSSWGPGIAARPQPRMFASMGRTYLRSKCAGMRFTPPIRTHTL